MNVGDQPDSPERLGIKPVGQRSFFTAQHHFVNAQSEDIKWDCVVKRRVPIVLTLIQQRSSEAGAAGQEMQVCCISATADKKHFMSRGQLSTPD